TMEPSLSKTLINFAFDLGGRFALGQQLTNAQHHRQDRPAAFSIPTRRVHRRISILQAVTIYHAVESVRSGASSFVAVLAKDENCCVRSQVEGGGFQREFDFLFSID